MTDISSLSNTNNNTKSNWLIAAIITFILAAIPFSIGKYYEFNTDDPFDGALNIYHAHELCLGKHLGVDVFPSARPATLLVNFIGVKLFGYSEFGPKLIQTLMQITALGFAFACVRKLFGNIPACFAVVLGAFYLSSQPYAKFGNVKEQYMIACMIISACAFIFYELDNTKKIWLFTCGALAINTWYFKPTGFSLLLAILAYMTVTTLMRKRTFACFSGQIVSLAIGSTIGLIPLIVFYLWQGQLGSLLGGFPAAPAILVTIIYCIILGLRKGIKVANQHTEKINKKIIQRGSIAIVSALVITTVAFSFMGQAKQFLMDIPIVGYPVELLSSAFDFSTSFSEKFYSLIFSDSGYVAGSRIVSTFSKQFAEVNRYSHSFVIPIGLGLAAIAWAIFSRFKKGNPETSSDTQSNSIINQIMIFLAIWWLLDMLFIWISPRTYVQYFLPPNGSAMFLAGYILCRSFKNNIAFCFIGAAWLAVEIFTASQSTAEYSALVIIVAIITFLAGAAAAVIKTLPKPKLILQAVFIIAILIANKGNYNAIDDKLESTRQFKEAGGALWQTVGKDIKNNSSENDTIFVWGWYPGIYVAAQRSCSAKHPAYANMHSDIPQDVGYRIDNYVEELSKNPPLFIVDSQKMHYPYYEHPVYDLWMTVPLDIGRNPKRNILQKKAEIQAFEKQYYTQVKKYCIALTTQEKRAGGPLSKEKAEELAELEVERHKKMEPLRDFVMKNYQPYKRFATMVVYKRK